MYSEELGNTALTGNIVTLLQKQLEGTILTAEEVATISAWKHANTENTSLYEKLQHPKTFQQLMQDWHSIEKTKSDNKARLLQEINRHSVHHVHFLKTTWFRYAAAIVLIFGAAAYFWATNKKTEQPLANNNRHLQTDVAPGRDRAILTLANGQQIILDSTQGNIVKQGNLTVVNLAGKLKYEGTGTATEYNTIATPKGGQYQIVLPDGSKVWLNAASSIKFPTAFTGNTRSVEMKGEVYMEISENSKQPFVVRANGMELQVLGTSFNVNAYEDETATKTTLISGSVKVMSKVQQKGIILKPGQQCSIVNGQSSVINNVNTEQTLAWKNGMFQFDWTDLADAMRQIARWYDVEVIYEKGIPALKLGGEMKRDLTLSQMLDALRELGVKLRVEGKRLIVM